MYQLMNSDKPAEEADLSQLITTNYKAVSREKQAKKRHGGITFDYRLI